MNILALTSSYPRYAGDPTAPFIESITKGVVALGHSVRLVLPANREWQRPAHEGDLGFRTYRYSPSRSWTPWGYSESLEGGVRIRPSLYPLAPAVLAAGVHAARSELRREPFDVIQAHWVIPNGPVAAVARAGRDIPLVVSLHGSDISVAERVGAIGRVARWTFARAAAVTAPSEDLLERAERLGARRELRVIPYGADVDSFRGAPADAARLRSRLDLPEDATVVCAIGRFVHWKGFDYLLQAIATARGRTHDLRLVLVGDGDLREELTAQARALGLADSVTFTGMVGRDELSSYLALADVVAVPSVHYDGYVDGLPNVALEAMAAGRALVATRVGGLPQLVRDGENGLLVDEKDADGLADAVVRLAGDGDLRARLGVAARQEMVQKRTWDVVAQSFVDVFERARRLEGRRV